MIKIKVPCSSANFGPGFDSIGVALNLYNTFSICEIESGLIIDGCPLEFQTADNIVYKAMENYEVFVSRYGNIKDYFTYLSIYFCSSQIVILVLIYIYKFIKRHTRMIKKRRIIK